MTVQGKIIGRSLVMVLMLFGLASIAHGQAGVGAGTGAPGAGFGGELRNLTFIRGNIICANCTADEARSAAPRAGQLYEFDHDLGQVVINVDVVRDRAWWESIMGMTNRVQVRAPESTFRRLMAEENLFKEVEIGGVLRNTRVFDIASIAVEPEFPVARR